MMSISGQILATSHDLTPKYGLVREIPLFSGKSRLVRYYNLTRYVYIYIFSPLPMDSCRQLFVSCRGFTTPGFHPVKPSKEADADRRARLEPAVPVSAPAVWGSSMWEVKWSLAMSSWTEISGSSG